jgi:hypothetical protein
LIAQPIIDAGSAIGSGRSQLAERQQEVTSVLVSLRAKVAAGGSQPTSNEVIAVERAAASLERLAAAMDPDKSPLARWDLADEQLTRQLLNVIRALEPSYTLGGASAILNGFIARIPAPPGAVLDEAVTAIEAFDLSVLTDPLQAVTNAVRTAVDEVNAAKESVRQALESALSPVADALDAALAAAGFNEIRAALEGLPAQIQNFVDNQITPNLESVRSGVSNAVSVVTNAADEFNPEALIAPIREAVENAAALLQNDTIRGAFAELERALDTAIEAIEGLDLSLAADQSIDLIGGIEVKVSAIDPADIPDASKPLLNQAVQVVTSIDFTAEVGGPLLDEIEQAAAAGPAVVLGAIEEGMDRLRASLESFRPSAVIGDALDQPFRQLLDTLNQFKPSDLLDRLQEALDSLAGRLSVLDVDVVVNPLIDLHTAVRNQVEALRPSNLLKPIEDEIAAAIEKVYQATGIDTIFAGINEVLDTIQTWTGLLADGRDLLNRGAALFEQPGDATASVQQLANDILAKLDSVDMARLQEAFQAASAAAASIERDVLARDVAIAFQTAGQSGPSLLGSSELNAMTRLGREFPLDELRAHRRTPARDRLLAAFDLWRASADRLEASRQRWTALGPELNEAAGMLQQRLLDYYRVSRIEGDAVFAEFLDPPRTTAELKDAVRRALSDALTDPLTTIILGFQAFAPYLRIAGSGIARILGALHAKIDSILGSGGVGGTVGAIEEAANLLRGINLQPVVQPLDAIYARIETAVAALDPEPLRAALQAARDAIANLLSVTTLVSQTDIDALDQAYAQAVAKIGQLAPSAIISETLDPVYEDLLQDFLPVLDLPVELRLKIEAAGRSLREKATLELARVEEAFDKMLRAIPLGDGGVSGSISVSGSVSVG